MISAPHRDLEVALPFHLGEEIRKEGFAGKTSHSCQGCLIFMRAVEISACLNLIQDAASDLRSESGATPYTPLPRGSKDARNHKGPQSQGAMDNYSRQKVCGGKREDQLYTLHCIAREVLALGYKTLVCCFGGKIGKWTNSEQTGEAQRREAEEGTAEAKKGGYVAGLA
ncbi:leucine-rich repeat-containing C10orf11 -like protein [Labeo rohita]|uniref:Leucine-rich repeat-containing C10orf11-like protein n=1 Tax=Labeo rohita TaxID=84645 RepID=A0A498MY92_LABRO|nr:leucine-rich repeat-containing C10orf11 -like protein [Labeo rohita]